MASPINKCNSRIFVLPDPESVLRNNYRNASRKYKILKALELVFALFTLIFFTMGDTASGSTTKDLAINACLGGIVLYPMICMAFSFNFYKTPRVMLIWNILNSLLLFMLSTLILSSWWQIEYVLDKSTERNVQLYYEKQLSATLRFMAALTGLINGIFYTSESLVMALELKGYV